MEFEDQNRNVDAKRAEMVRLMKHHDIEFSDDNSAIIDTPKPPSYSAKSLSAPSRIPPHERARI